MNDEETHETGGVSARVSDSARDSRERNQRSNRNFLFKFVSIFGVGSRTVRHLRPTHRSGASENDEKAIKYSWNVLETTARRKICSNCYSKSSEFHQIAGWLVWGIFLAIKIAVILLFCRGKAEHLTGNEGYFFQNYEHTFTHMKLHDEGE